MSLKVKVIAIRKDDLFYKYRKSIIGSVMELEFEDETTIDSHTWVPTIMNKELMSTHPQKYSGFAFKAIKVEVVE